jgi:aryl-alcohol dehydrogenase-like predicted oxidoreductase
MKYNLLGNTGLKVSELCLGTMTFGGKGFWTAIGTLDQSAVDQLVKKSVDGGINFIDTANVYSEGLSEEMTGKAIRNLGLNRDDLVIATKVRGKMAEGPNGSGLTRKHILHEIDASLTRLNLDYVDLYQIHGFDALTPLEETLDTLDGLVKSGKVRYIGCSNLAAWQIMKSVDYSTYHRLAKFVSLQAYYTLAGRDLEREVIPVLKDQNLGLMVWSPLAGGLLSGKYKRNGENEGGRRVNFDFPPVNKDRVFDVVEALEPMAKEKGVSKTLSYWSSGGEQAFKSKDGKAGYILVYSSAEAFSPASEEMGAYFQDNYDGKVDGFTLYSGGVGVVGNAINKKISKN